MANAELILLLPSDPPPGPPVVPAEQTKNEQYKGTPENDAHFVVKYLLVQNWFGTGKNEPMDIAIPSKEPGLTSVLRRELLSAYVLHGWPGIRQFSAGVFGLDAYTDLIKANGLQQRSFGGPLTGDKADEAMSKNVAEDRRPLWNAYETEKRLLRERIAEREALLQKAAWQVGQARLARCRELLLSEAQRYLSLAEPKLDSAKRVLAGGDADARVQAVTGLRGRDGPALLGALKELQPRFHALQRDRKDFLATRGLEAAEKAAQFLPGMQPFAALARGAGVVPDTGTMQARALAIASDDFATAFGRAAAGFPVLFRLVKADPDKEREIALAVIEILQDAWQACAALESDLGTPEIVWTLPKLVERAVSEKFPGDFAFTERVGADRLRRVSGEVHPMEALNFVVSGLDTALMLVPFPPLQLGMVVIGLLANIAETAEAWVRDAGKRHSSRAALDPSLALAAEPSILGLVAQAFLLAQCVLPVPGLAKEVRELKKATAVVP